MDDVYRTSDQGFAAYLMLRGFYCVKAIPSEDKRFPERKDLVFIDVTNPKELEDEYFRYKPEKMSARAFFEKMRAVRQIVREGLTEAEMEKYRGQN